VIQRNKEPMSAVGYGKSKKEAEQHAAKKLLHALKSL
jgi:dsRNA-specific ribonuclease